MSDRIAAGSIVTDIKINEVSASSSLKELKNAIKGTTTAWRAEQAALKAAGQASEAAAAKYKGLNDSVDKQKLVIERLENTQLKYRKILQETNTDTEKGKKAYNDTSEALRKNGLEILSAQRRLASLTTQRDKARKAMDYQTSGLAKLQKDYRATTNLSKSYVDRLQSEGKTYQANQARINGYKSSIVNLTKQYEIQSKELQRIANESGRTSSAYKLQQTRVNETATSINKAKSAVGQLEEQNRKLNTSTTMWDKFKAKLTCVSGQAEKTHKTLKEVFMGSALGNAVTNAVGNLSGQLKSAYEEGMNLNLAVAKINGRFKAMGLNKKQIAALDKQIGELKANTNATGDNVASLQTKMLNWSQIGVKGAMQMTRTIAGVADSSKLTGDQMEQLGAGLMRVGSTGKVTFSALNRITKTAPTFYAQLAKGAGMSETKLKSLLRSGKVTQKQFQEWMANASKYSDEAFKGFTGSQAGALKQIQVAKQKLEQTFTKPIFDAKTSGLQALKNILTSKEVLSGADQLGKAISNVIVYLDKHKADITGVVKDVVSLGVNIGKQVWKDFSAIVVDIAKSFGLIHGNAKGSGDALHRFRLAMDGLAKNKAAIQIISKSIIAMMAVKGATKLSSGILGIAGGAYKAYKNIKALRTGMKGLDLAKEATTGEKAWAKFGSTLSKTSSLFKNTGKGGLNGALQSIRSARKSGTGLSAAGKISTAVAGAGVAIQSGVDIYHAIKDKTGSKKQYEDIGKGAGSAIGGGIGLYFGGPLGAAVGAQIGSAVGKWAGDAAKKFQNGWNAKKPPKKFWSLENLGWSTHDMLNKVGKWGSDVGKKFGQSLSKGKSFVKKNGKELALTAISPILGVPALLYKNNPKFRKWANSVGKTIKGGLHTASKTVKSWGNTVSKDFKKTWDNIYKHSSKGTKQIIKGTTKFAKNYVKINQKANKDTIKNFSSFGKRLKKNHGNLFKTIGQTAKTQLNIEKKRWSSHFKNVQKLAKSWAKGLHSNAVGLYKKLNTATHGGLGKVFKGFQDFGKNIAKFWSNLWKGITKTFDDTVKNIQGGIDNVKKFFSGKLKVGNIHLANGTDWKSKYGYPAVLNDGNDSPRTGNVEGILNPDGTVEPVPGRYTKRWIFPGQDVIKASDMAKLFAHRAGGTLDIRRALSPSSAKIFNLLKKKYDEDKTRHTKQKERHDKNDKSRENERKELKKRAESQQKRLDSLRDQLKKASKGGKDTSKLVAEFNKASKDLSETKKKESSLKPHAGQVYVDRGLLLGAKERIGTSEWISKKLFEKLTAKSKKKRKTKKRKTESNRTKRKSTTRKTTQRYSSTSTTRRIASAARVSSVSSAASSVVSSVAAKVTGTKTVKALAKAIKAVKGTHKVNVKVKASGLTKANKSVNKLKSSLKSVRKSKSIKLRASYKSVPRATKALKGLGSATKTVTKDVKRSKFGQIIKKQAEEAVKSLKGKGNFAKTFESLTKKFSKNLNSLHKDASKNFKSMWSDINKSETKGQKTSLSKLSSFKRSYTNGWKSLENGIKSTFNKFWSSLRRTAVSGLNGVIRVLNQGIGSIDSVISDFGGSKNAVHKASMVHYATGTGYFNQRRTITKPTLAVLNDGDDSPETGNREGVYDKRNGHLTVVEGRNVPKLLMPYHEVFNATEMRELGFTRYATGTGYLKRLYEQAKKYWNKPTKTGKAMFSNVSGLKGAGNQLAQKARDKSVKQGVAWWSQLWKMAEEKVNDGAGNVSGLLKEAIKVSKGHRYVWGAKGPDEFDCSGLVEYAAKQLGITLTAPSGSQYSQVEHIPRSKIRQNDLVFYGPDGDEHVGIVRDKNTYWSAHSPSSHPNIGYDSIDDAPAHPILFGRIRGYNPKNDKDADVKVNSKLQEQIKDQVGKGFWKTIQKIADKFGDNGMAGAFKLGGDIGARAKALAKALKQAVPGATRNGLAGVIGSWEFESGGLNPAAVNPNGGASGLGQWLGPRLTNLKAYARRHHKSWTDPATQINFAVNEEGSDSAILRRILQSNGSPTKTATDFSRLWERGGYDAQHASAARQIAGYLRGFANGGIASEASIFGEAGPEMAIPLVPSKASRAWELVGKAVTILSGHNSNNSNSLSALEQEKENKDHQEEREFREAVIMLLTQIAGKSDVAKITLQTPAGRALWSVIEPFQKQEMKSEITKLRRGLSGRI